jgi:DnaJ homolog subfamily C member 28
MEAAISAFRRMLRHSWTPRAIRILFTNHTPSALTCLSARDVTRLRDAEWEAREKAYHDKALDAVNNVVRRYNAMAPYAVRKSYFVRGVELEKLYEDCREDIIAGIQNRLVEPPGQPQDEPPFAEKETDPLIVGNTNTLRNWVRSWYARWTH